MSQVKDLKGVDNDARSVRSAKSPGRGAKAGERAAEEKEREQADRDAACFARWLEGATLRVIADEQGWMAPSSAMRAIERHRRRTPMLEVETIRLESLTVLRTARGKVLRRLEFPDLTSSALCRLVAAVVAIEARIAAIVGADAPKQTQLTGANAGPIQITSEEEQTMVLRALHQEVGRRLELVDSEIE